LILLFYIYKNGGIISCDTVFSALTKFIPWRKELRSNLSGNGDSDFPLPSQQPILKRQNNLCLTDELTLNFHEEGVGIFINAEDISNRYP
jgi:hypothetical protein